jgi:hypothetical protein
MRMRLLGSILVISSVVILGWCFEGWSSEQKEDKESYKKQVEEKLNTVDKKLNELKAKSVEVKDDAKKEFNREMAELQKKQKAAKQKWVALKKTSAKKWDKVKSEMSSAVQDLEDTYEKVVSRFKEWKK